MRRELVDTKHALAAAEQDYLRMGWDVIDRTPGQVTVERGRRGAWGWHLLFLILVPLVGNLCYSAYRRYNRPEQMVVRIRGFADANTGVDDDSDQNTKTSDASTQDAGSNEDVDAANAEIIANRWD